MSPIERLRAAIEKLEHLRDEATLGPWIVETIPETGESRVVRRFEFFGGQIEEVAPGRLCQDDADLIVTLHRTVDAQLAVLRFAVEGLYDLPEFLALADAVLGGEQ